MSYTTGRPAYMRIADRLRRALAEGQWTPGDQLPSANDLAQRWGATRTTVQSAIEALRREGLLYTQQGRGAFVRELAPQREFEIRHSRWRTGPLIDPVLQDSGIVPRFRLINVGLEHASPEIATRLGLSDDDDRVLARRFLMLDDEVPLELLASFFVYHLAATTRLADPSPMPSYHVLRQELSIQVGSVVQDLRARMPTPDEARHLELGEGDAVLHIFRTAYDVNGSPVNVLEALLPGHRHVIREHIALDP